MNHPLCQTSRGLLLEPVRRYCPLLSGASRRYGRCVFRVRDEFRDGGSLISTQRTAVRRAHLVDLLLPVFERQRRLGINHAARMTKEAVLIDNCDLFAVSCE